MQMSRKHIIKLAVGVETIQQFYDIQRPQIIDYEGQAAVPCWTRYKPKESDAILDAEGSIYRVVKNRIICRHKILGFEMVENTEKGTMCAIMQDAQMIETIAQPRRSFQGWRYLKESDAPADKGIYTGDSIADDIPEDMRADLEAAGLL
jgi:hypothetical protein